MTEQPNNNGGRQCGTAHPAGSLSSILRAQCPLKVPERSPAACPPLLPSSHTSAKEGNTHLQPLHPSCSSKKGLWVRSFKLPSYFGKPLALSQIWCHSGPPWSLLDPFIFTVRGSLFPTHCLSRSTYFQRWHLPLLLFCCY